MGYARQTLQKVTLPSDPKYWVEIDTDLTYGEIKSLGAGEATNEVSDKYLSLVIKGWNLDDVEDKPLELNIENINLLRQDDVLAIIAVLNKEAEGADAKKPSTN